MNYSTSTIHKSNTKAENTNSTLNAKVVSIAKLNKNVKAYIRYIKSFGVELQDINKSEMAQVCGAGEKYFFKNKTTIEAYYEQEHFPSKQDRLWFENRSRQHYINSSQSAIENIGSMVGWVMKYEYKLLSHLQKQNGVIAVGINVFKVASAIRRRKNENGTPLHTKSKAVHNLYRQNKVSFIDRLFSRSTYYKSNHQSKLWKTTELCDEIIYKAIEYFLEVVGNEQNFGNLTAKSTFEAKKAEFCFLTLNHLSFQSITYGYQSCSTYSRHMYYMNSTHLNLNHNRVLNNNDKVYNNQEEKAPKSQKYTIDSSKYTWYIRPLVIEIGLIHAMSFHSQIVLLSNMIVIENGYIIINANHLSETDATLGRTYNVFTMMKSEDRLKLGFISYDISSALQTISLQLINATKEDYPLLYKYSFDNSYKKELRRTIAKDLNIAISEVKQQLTAYSNGSEKGIDKHHLYKHFQIESLKLMQEVVKHTSSTNKELLEQSIKQTKKANNLEIAFDEISTDKTLNQKKSGVFFFIWTWYERQIRKVMCSFFDDALEVHDAVYSKVDLECSEIEAKIRIETGFKVQITKEFFHTIKKGEKDDSQR